MAAANAEVIAIAMILLSVVCLYGVSYWQERAKKAEAALAKLHQAALERKDG